MKLKKLFSAACALMMSVGIMSLPAVAEESTESLPDGVYARAGIVWMVMDQWDHRNTLDTEPLNEMETDVVSCIHHDVYITGNGQYTVDMSGYVLPDEYLDSWLMGNFGVEFTIDKVDAPENDDITITFDNCVIDGVTYTFNTQPEYEESTLGTVMKIKNPYGTHADCTPEMDDSVWKTDGVVSVTFTITGLETDKIEDYADETIEKVFGSGSVVADREAAAAESTADESTADESTEEDATADETTEEETTTAEETTTDSTESGNSDSTSNLPLIIGICAGVVIVVVIIAVVVKKKK